MPKKTLSKQRALGQFFTPLELARELVGRAEKFLVNREMALDPACGEGVFLLACAEKGFEWLVGIDIDEEALEIADKLLNIPPPQNIWLQNSDALMWVEGLEGKYDMVATNPPFSAVYGRVSDPEILQRYELGRGRKSVPIEVLFLELSVRALRENGVLVIILPEGIAANSNYDWVRRWLFDNLKVEEVVSLGRKFFKARCVALIGRKVKVDADYKVRLSFLDVNGRAFHDFAYTFTDVSQLISNASPRFHLSQKEASAFLTAPLDCFLKEIVSGASYRRKDLLKEPQKGALPYILAHAVQPLGVDYSAIRFYVPLHLISETAITKPKDVVFVRVGAGCIGRATAVAEDDKPCIASDFTYILRFNENVLLPEFFVLLTLTRHFVLQLRALERGTGAPTIPKSALKEIEIPTVPLQIQQEFVSSYRTLRQRWKEGHFVERALSLLISDLEKVLRGERDVATA